LCYGVGDGLLRDLEVTLHGEDCKKLGTP